MDITYELAPFQSHFITGEDRVVAIVAGKGAGKTWSGARFVAYQIAMQPNSQGLVMLNSRQQVMDIFDQDIRPLFEELNWPYSYNAQSLNVKVFNTVIHLRSADPDATKKIESIAYHWGWADEASFYPPDTLRTFVSRVRKGKAFIRITSMPDEPDAFMYDFIENLGGYMYELGIRDNPDREFADRYEQFLRATYSGAQLERFLSGKRVSLTGEGLFSVDPGMKREDVRINPDDEILLSWDFNVEYRAVSAWQMVARSKEGYPIVGCVASWRMKGATVYEDSIHLATELRAIMKNRVLLHGDASGKNRTAQATDSMWKTVKENFENIFGNVSYIVPNSNPPVKDTIQCLNWALRLGLVLFNDSERNVYNSLQAIKADRYGEIDKSIDYRDGTSARTHEADTARYAVWHYFKYDYPGASGGIFIV
jgi:phage terminase large subunit-like protein